jgi:predicted lysophospholipase L1 biosynthesis ABC-type transport system permease subunit
VINESTARRFWPGESAIGKRLKSMGDDHWLEVIGVVGDVRYLAQLSEPDTRLQLYRPLVQTPGSYLHVALRSSVAPATLTNAVRRAIAEVDPDLPVREPRSVREKITKARANMDLVSELLVCSAALGLLLSALGIYGVVANLMVQRVQEIGIRLALGATHANVLWLVLRSGLRLVLIGTTLGLAGATVLRQLFRAVMPILAGTETWTMLLVTLGLAIVTLFACWLPARRATKVDPMIALRAE